MPRKLLHKILQYAFLNREIHSKQSTIILFLFLIGFLSKTQGQDPKSQNLEDKVNQLIALGIEQQAFPGAQVILYKKDSVLVNQSYGYHTYDSLKEVKSTDLYDLASVTKVMASTLVFMKLYEMYNIDLDQKVSEYVPLLKRSNKKNTTFRQVLSHSGGWIPYLTHQTTVFRKKGTLKRNTLAMKASPRFPTQISENWWIHKNYTAKIFRRIRKTPLESVGTYSYSGLWFFLLPQLTQQLSGLSFDEFLNTHFYTPMGLDRITFLPRKKFPLDEIVPTEQDTLFRKQLVRGWVHDEAAAMMGGVSGNAGLFSNANSLYPLLVMLLQKGTYKENQYLKPETVTLFTQRAYPNTDNRRGLGFDKPSVNKEESSYPSQLASPESFGHTGFTGTFIWADPQQEAFVIFLSNRVYPYRSQTGLYDLNIRGQLLDYVLED